MQETVETELSPSGLSPSFCTVSCAGFVFKETYKFTDREAEAEQEFLWYYKEVMSQVYLQ